MDLRIILCGGFGPLKFGASPAEMMDLLGPPDDLLGPPHELDRDATAAELRTGWPTDDQHNIECDYEQLSTTVVLQNTKDRGPCVVYIRTQNLAATLFGNPVIDQVDDQVIAALEVFGVSSFGTLEDGGGYWRLGFTHGLLLRLYHNRVIGVDWGPLYKEHE